MGKNQEHERLPWTTLITVGAPVIASLGAVWIKGLYDDRAQARQADETRTAAQSDRRQQTYADLVKTSLLALRNFRELGLVRKYAQFDAPEPDAPEPGTPEFEAGWNESVGPTARPPT